MSLTVQTNAAGVMRAQRQFTEAASRVSRWGLPGTSEDPAYTLELNGAARPRRYGMRPPRSYSLSGEVVNMRQAEHGYRANLSALKTSLDMDDALLEITSGAQESEGGEEG